MPTPLQNVLSVSKAEVGVREGFKNGHWNNDQKYSREVPGLAWSNFQPWCATWVSWVAWKAGAADLYPRTASCDAAGAWFKKAGRWSEYPAIGAQVFFGHPRDLNHTGIVVDYDADTITTREGNTNLTGSREGNGVYQRTRQRRSPDVIGYGYPAFPGGIKSADPAWSTGIKATPAPAKPTTPAGPALPVPVTGVLRVDGADLSHHNTGITVAGLVAFWDAGGRFVYHKATESHGFIDTQYPTRRKLVDQANARIAARPGGFGGRAPLWFGGYHFARPNNGLGDARDEAEFFLAHATPHAGDMLPALDLEADGHLSRPALSAWVEEFADELERQLKVRGVIYTPFDLATRAGMLLWVARYHPTNKAPEIPEPWDQAEGWSIRQFSNGVVGRPHTVAGLGAVDLNTLKVKPSESIAFLRIPTAAAVPVPAPVVPPTPAPVTPAPAPVPVPGPVTPAPAPVPSPAPAPTTQRTMRIGTWNLKRDRTRATVLHELQQLVKATDVDVLMVQEANDYWDQLGKVPGYQRVGVEKQGKAAEPYESMMLVRDGLTVTDVRIQQVTFDPDGKGKGIAGWFTTAAGGHTPAKYVTIATVEGFPFVSYHPAPSAQTAALRLRYPLRWRSYQESQAKVADILRALGRGVVAADWNWDARKDDGTNPSSPKAVLNRVGWKRVFPATGTDGTRPIDGFGIRGGALSEVKTHDPAGSDHRPVTALLTSQA